MTSTVTTPLDSWIEDFNPKQAEAYGFDGHCAVLAGPGSGKTRVLVAKVARLISEKASGPRGVACVTFNNEAVREMRKRLAQLGLKSGKRLFIGTVHSFCIACVVAPFGHLFREDLRQGLTVAGTHLREQALQQAIDTLGLGGRTTDWQTQFDRYRRTHPLRDSKQWSEDPDMVTLIETYEGLLHSQGLLDYDDMVLIALDLMRHHKFVRSALEARFPFLVVDEYQDLGYPLHLIVRLLMRNTDIEVFAVGDPDQSIYGFAGADPTYLRNLAQDPAVHRVELVMNYRSAQRIIDGSQVALAPEEPRNYKSARDGVDGELFFFECPGGLGQQADLIATQIIPSVQKKGVASGHIAILYIDRWDELVLSKALNDAGIKYAGERDQRYPRTPFTRWLEDVAAWCSLFPETQQGPALDDLFYSFTEMKADAGISVDPGDLSVRTEFFEALTHVAEPDMPLGEWLEQLDSLLDLESCLAARKAHPDDLADWNLIKRRCQDGEALAGFNLDDFARCGGRPDTVTLTTLHSSKGLEYEVVIMPGLEQGRLPGYAATSAGALAEARRVFYVGMTRAKDTIYLLYSGWYKDRYNRIWRNGPSQFVSELQARIPSST
jgi:DNA helicase-2/ATP-dependent DNA helicase PcrA